MRNLNGEWALFGIVTTTLMLTSSSVFTGTVLAVKKGSSSCGKTSSKTTATSASHVKGVKVFRMYTIPSRVAVGKV